MVPTVSILSEGADRRQLVQLLHHLRPYAEATDLMVGCDVPQPWMAVRLTGFPRDYEVLWSDGQSWVSRVVSAIRVAEVVGSPQPVRRALSGALASLKRAISALMVQVAPSTAELVDNPAPGLFWLARQPNPWTASGAVEWAVRSLPNHRQALRPLLSACIHLLAKTEHALGLGRRLAEAVETHATVPEWQSCQDLMQHLPPPTSLLTGFATRLKPEPQFHSFYHGQQRYVVAPNPMMGAWLRMVSRGLVEITDGTEGDSNPT